MSEPRHIVPTILRSGLNELFSLPGGIDSAITHIGIGTAKYTPDQDQKRPKKEIIRVPVIDMTEPAPNQIMFYAEVPDWDGELTACYELTFYLESGNPFAIYSSDVVELVLLQGSPNDLFYTLALDAVPEGKLRIISTETVFVPESRESLDTLSITQMSHTLSLDNAHKQLHAQSQRDSNHSDALKSLVDKNAVRAAETQKNYKRIQQLEFAQQSQSLARRRMLDEIIPAGIVSVRDHAHGDDAYNTELGNDHVGVSAKLQHTHSNYGYKAGGYRSGVMGMGEWRVSLHNELFDTRHIDNTVAEPIPGTFNVRAIPTPVTPASIQAKIDAGDTEGAIAETREYFKAMVNNDPNHRPFDQHIKAVMTVMEAFDVITESGDKSASFRHQADVTENHRVSVMSDLYASTGAQTQFQNVNHPIFGLNASRPEAPLLFKTDWRMFAVELGLLKDYKPEDCLRFDFDPVVADRFNHSYEQQLQSRQALFAVRQKRGSDTDSRVSNTTMLDDWMRNVPGLSGGGIDFTIKERGKSFTMSDPRDTQQPLDAGMAFRYFGIPRDATARSIKRLGWNTTTAWIALNNRPEILPRIDPVTMQEYRHSSFLPSDLTYYGFWQNIEFNIYDLPYIANQRKIKGDGSFNRPYTGINENGFMYNIPAACADGVSVPNDPAATGGDAVYVLDKKGNKRLMMSGGFRIFSPKIGNQFCRLRYPIIPVSWKQNPVYQALLSDRARMQRATDALAISEMHQMLNRFQDEDRLESRLRTMEVEMNQRFQYAAVQRDILSINMVERLLQGNNDTDSILKEIQSLKGNMVNNNEYSATQRDALAIASMNITLNQ